MLVRIPITLSGADGIEEHKMIALLARRTLVHPLCALVLTIVLGCWAGSSAAQAPEPNIRIDIGGDYSGLQFSPNGDYLLVVGYDSVRRYNLSRHRFDSQLSFPRASLDSFAISSDGTRLARIISETPEIQIIDFNSGELLNTSYYPRSHVFRPKVVTFSHDDAHLIVSESKKLHVWNLLSRTWHTLSLASDGVFSLSKTGHLVTKSGGVVSSLLEVRPFYSSEPAISKTIEDFLDDIAISNDGSKILLNESRRSHKGKSEHVWYVLDRQTLVPLNEPWILPALGRLYRDSTWLDDRPIALYTMTSGPGIAIFDLYSRGPLLSLPTIDPSNVVLSPDGRWLAVVRNNSFADVYALAVESARNTIERVAANVEQARPRLVPQLPHRGDVRGLAVSRDGRIVALGGDDGYVSLWDRVSGKVFRRLSDGKKSVRALALSPDGSQVLASMSPGGALLWDVASGKLLQRLDEFHYGDGDAFVAFLADGTQTLLCRRHECTLQHLSPDVQGRGTRLHLGEDVRSYSFYYAVSLAPDEESVSLALGDDGVGWMELHGERRRRVIKVPGNTEVTSVAALGDAWIAAGLSNGEVLLIDAVEGRILKTLRTRETGIGAMIRLDDERLVVASDGRGWLGKADDPAGEILVVSSKDLLVQKRLTWSQPMGDGGRPSSAYIQLLAAGGDGGWLASASQHDAHGRSRMSLVQLWDTDIAQATGVFQAPQPLALARRVQFDENNDLLLVRSQDVASLWNLKDGRVIRQFRYFTTALGYEGSDAIIRQHFQALTADQTGVVVETRGDRLLVLDAADRETRFALENSDFYPTRQHSVPVVNLDVVQGVLRLRQTESVVRLERLSLDDGSIIDSTNLGINSLAFAVSNRVGTIYLVADDLVADGKGGAVLWDTSSGERTAFEAGAAGPENVAFSYDGQLLAIAEADGTVRPLGHLRRSIRSAAFGPTDHVRRRRLGRDRR